MSPRRIFRKEAHAIHGWEDVTNLDTAIVCAVGGEKRGALARLGAGVGMLPNTPVRVLRKLKGRVCMFTEVE